MPAATRWLRDIFKTHFNTEKDDLHAVALDPNNNKYTGAKVGNPLGYQPGVYLPDVGSVYEQLNPGFVQNMANDAVAIYVGPVSGAEYGVSSLKGTAGSRKMISIPYLARLLFRRAPQEPVFLADQDRHATTNEIAQWRKQAYIGALMRVVDKFGTQTDVIELIQPNDFEPLNTQVVQLDIHGNLTRSMVGEASYSFTVKQEIIASCP